MKVGITRALYHFYHGPGWEAFFRTLGHEVVLSPPTDKVCLDRGVAHALRDLCLPVKAFFGHLEAFEDDVDRIFVPRLVSIDPVRYYCPKFLALVDLAATRVDRSRLLTAEWNAKKGDGFLAASLDRMGRTLGHGARGTGEARRAMEAVLVEREEKRREAYAAYEAAEGAMKIALLGHPYLVHDLQLSHGVLDWLQDHGVSVVTHELLPAYVLSGVDTGLFRDVYWESAWDLFRSGVHLMLSGVVRGAVLLTAFGCGPDSLVADLLLRRAREDGFPLVQLVLDEHTARTGVETRLEAFLDMVGRGQGGGAGP